MAIRDGQILTVGDTAGVRETCDAKTVVIDGAGMTLVPGLVDAHQHGVSAGDFARGVNLAGVTDPGQLRQRLEGGARHLSGTERGYPDGALTYAAFGRGDFIRAHPGCGEGTTRVDPHVRRSYGAGHRRALELAGVVGPVEPWDGSVVVCRDGVPTGELREYSAIQLVAGAIPPATREEHAQLRQRP